MIRIDLEKVLEFGHELYSFISKFNSNFDKIGDNLFVSINRIIDYNIKDKELYKIYIKNKYIKIIKLKKIILIIKKL